MRQSKYKLPSHGDTIAADFFALWTLWCTHQKSPNKPVVDAINKALKECTKRVAELMVAEVQREIYQEMHHVLEPVFKASPRVATKGDSVYTLYSGRELKYNHAWEDAWEDNGGFSQDVLKEWLRSANDRINSAFILLPDIPGSMTGELTLVPFDEFWTRLTTNDVAKMFRCPVWQWKFSYGGNRWARISEVLGQLMEAVHHELFPEVVMLVDQMYDIQHNTGQLFVSKTKRLKLSVAAFHRKNMHALHHFVEWVSDGVFDLMDQARSI